MGCGWPSYRSACSLNAEQAPYPSRPVGTATSLGSQGSSSSGKDFFLAAKYAVSGFTETLAMELGPDNIRVNGIVPGNVNGDRIERVIATTPRSRT